MKLVLFSREIVVNIICWLFILLFVYAAVSKLLDFENFKMQTGQSPLISAFAGWVVWLLPLTELIIAAALSFERLRVPSMFAAFSLMVMFSAYIFIILNYSSFIPCSCGGILEKMGWREHLWFNLAFVLLALVALWLLCTSTQPSK